MKGLKLYENIFTDSELTKLIDLANELRAAGQNGELSGDLVPQLLMHFPFLVKVSLFKLVQVIIYFSARHEY